MRNRPVAYFSIVLLELFVGRTALAADFNDFIDFSLRSGETTLLPGRLYVPPEAASGPRPLITFLHGGGDARNDNMRQLNQNIEQLFAEAERRGAFLYAPQAPQNWRPRTVTDRTMMMIDRALADYNVDASRLYLTGYSSGGGGVWNMLSRYPGEFAVGVPVAPVSTELDFLPANLVGQPIAAFHARDDAIASVGTTRTIITRILRTARRPSPDFPALTDPDFIHSDEELDLHYIEPADGGHSVLFSVYNRPELYEWMFAHGSTVPEPETMIGLLIGLVNLFVGGGNRGRGRPGSLKI